MINEPVVDRLVEKLGTPEHPASRYALCVVVAKRARRSSIRNRTRASKSSPAA